MSKAIENKYEMIIKIRDLPENLRKFMRVQRAHWEVNVALRGYAGLKEVDIEDIQALYRFGSADGEHQKEYQKGRAEGNAWASVASLDVLARAGTKATVNESTAAANAEGEDTDCGIYVLTPFEDRYEIATIFRKKYESSDRYFAEDCNFPISSDYPNSLFRAYEDGWINAAREFWNEIMSELAHSDE